MKAQEAIEQRINELCKKNKITINKLAMLSGMPTSTIKNIKYGASKNTGIATIKKICDGFDINIKEFFDDEIFETLEQEIE